jgi:hypothetical protein
VVVVEEEWCVENRKNFVIAQKHGNQKKVALIIDRSGGRFFQLEIPHVYFEQTNY